MTAEQFLCLLVTTLNLKSHDPLQESVMSIHSEIIYGGAFVVLRGGEGNPVQTDRETDSDIIVSRRGAGCIINNQ